jgi:hypothetical protein
MLERFKLTDCNSVQTPMDPGQRLDKSMGPSTPDDVAFSAVGALMSLAITTRPDIMNAVSILSRFNTNPGPAHWKAVKHLFCYLKGTMQMKLVYKPTDSPELFTAYSDADHGGCKDSGRSTGGYLVKVGSGAVSWSSKLQPLVALSTTEAEYIAAVEAGKEILWMRNILSEFGYSITSPSTLFIDNQSAINVSKNPEHHGRMKHLDLRFYWLRDKVEGNLIAPMHVRTEYMPADILTKPVPRAKVEVCRRLMGLEE